MKQGLNIRPGEKLERVRLYSSIKKRRGQSKELTRPLRLAVGITALFAQDTLKPPGFVWAFLLRFLQIKALFKSECVSAPLNRYLVK